MHIRTFSCIVMSTFSVFPFTFFSHILFFIPSPTLHTLTLSSLNQAYTKEGDQVLHDQYYSNKSRPYGILHASKADSLAQQQKCLDELNSTMQGLSAQEAAITRNLDNLEVYILYVCKVVFLFVLVVLVR